LMFNKPTSEVVLWKKLSAT